MAIRTYAFEDIGPAGATPGKTVGDRPELISLALLSAWCGLVAGLLEVATIVLRKRLFDSNQLYGMSRHFIWLVPTTNLCVFLALGFLGAPFILCRPRRGRWIFSRFLCAVTLLPMTLVAFPQIYALASLAVTIGIARWLVPLLEHNARGFRRSVRISFPFAVGAMAILGASPWVLDRIKQSR